MKKIFALIGVLGLSGLALTACKEEEKSVDIVEQDNEEKELTVDTDSVTLNKLGEGYLLKAFYGDKEILDASFESSKPEVAKVYNGYIVGLASGKSIITVTYKNQTKDVVVNVNSEFSTEIKADDVINVKSTDSKNVVLEAKVTTPNVFCEDFGVEWTSDNEDVVEVNKTTGEITAKKAGIATVTATSILKQTTHTSLQMGGRVFDYYSTDSATDSVTIIVDNEYLASTYSSLAGKYSAHYDWIGFANGNLTKDNPIWTEENAGWIRSLLSLEINENGTFKQAVYNAQRSGYSYDSTKAGGTTYEDQSAKYKNAYVYNRYSQSSTIADAHDGYSYLNIQGMADMGANNFVENGAFAIIDGQLILVYNGQAKTLGAAQNNAWLETAYTPFKNMVSMSENMTMILSKE